MKVIFTDHAKLRMQERDITMDEVCAALLNPEEERVSHTGAKQIFSTVSRGKICVVYVEKVGNAYVIISVWWRKKL